MAAITDITKNFSISHCKYKSCNKELKEDQIKKCARCREAIYCGTECQKKDWKAVHKTECREPPVDTTTPYTKENECIRRNFSTYETQVLEKTEKNNHVLQTQKAILEGSGHLNPDTSVVVVVGAQFYGDKFVDPLPELLEKCKKLILVDVDPVTLEKLHTLLGKDPKVSTVVLDLTYALKDLPDFYAKASKLSQKEFIKSIYNFLEKVTQDAEKREPGLLSLLNGSSADYVISSLVGSQLTVRLKETLFSLFTKKFGSPVASAMDEELLIQGRDLLRSSIHALLIMHAKDLCACAGKEGRVYFADTYRGNSDIIITKKTLDTLVDLLNKRKEPQKVTLKDWHWISNKNCDYGVVSLLS